MAVQGGKFLSFYLGEEYYGITIKKAKEIIGLLEITHVPKTKSYIKGVINLRGKIVPLVDLRLKFGMEERPYTERTCVVIIDLNTAETFRMVGIVVDAVAEVVNLAAEDIEPPPQYEAKIDGDLLLGLGKIKEKVIMLIDIEQILNRDVIISIKSVLSDAKETAAPERKRRKEG